MSKQSCGCCRSTTRFTRRPAAVSGTGCPACHLACCSTVGAKTGQPRTSTLSYAHDGDSYLIVASNAGSDRYPAWYHNLRKYPECEINIGPKRFAVTSRRITPEDADYPRLWQRANKNNANRYNGYQRQTSRPIPIFALTAS